MENCGGAVQNSSADQMSKVEQLDLSKTKATDLLKAHEGDPIKAMTAYVMAPI